MKRLLLGYFLASVVYAVLCGIVGRSYDPLAAFQTYALGCAAALATALIGGRLLGAWKWRRLWPPNERECAAAAGSVLVLTTSTLAFLFPASLTSIVVMKAGTLLLVMSRRPALPLLACVAAILASWHAPAGAAVVPLSLAAIHVFGYWLKLRATSACSAEFDLAAEQVVVAALALAVASVFSHWRAPAPVSDLRLWGVALASAAAGLFSTRLLLRPEPSSRLFPAYRMAGLIAAAVATLARGEHLGPTSWAALGIACLVVYLSQRQKVKP